MEGLADLDIRLARRTLLLRHCFEHVKKSFLANFSSMSGLFGRKTREVS